MGMSIRFKIAKKEERVSIMHNVQLKRAGSWLPHYECVSQALSADFMPTADNVKPISCNVPHAERARVPHRFYYEAKDKGY